MTNIFLPGYFLIGGVGLLAGAGLGEFLAHRFPHQRILLAVGLYAALAVSIFAGADMEGLMTGLMGSVNGSSPGISWFVGKQMFILGVLSGAALFLQQRHRPSQVIALAISGMIGLPIMMNLWMGAGITYATSPNFA